MEKRIEIHSSKLKLLKFLVISAIFLAAGIWMLKTNPQVGNPIFNEPIVKYIAASLGTLMGVLGLFFFTKKFFDKNPSITIDDTGVTVNAGAFNYGHIPWDNIGGVHERIIHAGFFSKQKFVTIALLDPESFILKETSKFKRRMMFMNLKNYGSPIQITSNALNINHEALMELLKSHLLLHKDSAK